MLMMPMTHLPKVKQSISARRLQPYMSKGTSGQLGKLKAQTDAAAGVQTASADFLLYLAHGCCCSATDPSWELGAATSTGGLCACCCLGSKSSLPRWLRIPLNFAASCA